MSEAQSPDFSQSPSPALAPARAAFAATENCRGALLAFIAMGGDLASPLGVAHLRRAVECQVTAMARLNDVIDLINAAASKAPPGGAG